LRRPSPALSSRAKPQHNPLSPPKSSAQRWRQAEAALVQAYIARGDVVGAARAEDFIFQMSRGQAGRQMPSLESLPDEAPPVEKSFHCIRTYGISVGFSRVPPAAMQLS
jgi:hypothetical protein